MIFSVLTYDEPILDLTLLNQKVLKTYQSAMLLKASGSSAWSFAPPSYSSILPSLKNRATADSVELGLLFRAGRKVEVLLLSLLHSCRVYVILEELSYRIVLIYRK